MYQYLQCVSAISCIAILAIEASEWIFGKAFGNTTVVDSRRLIGGLGAFPICIQLLFAILFLEWFEHTPYVSRKVRDCKPGRSEPPPLSNLRQLLDTCVGRTEWWPQFSECCIRRVPRSQKHCDKNCIHQIWWLWITLLLNRNSRQKYWPTKVF